MRRKLLAGLLMLPALLFGLSAAGLIPNITVSGPWTLQATIDIPEIAVCEYSGTAQITQEGSSFSGTAELSLDSGGETCPAELSADISGTVAGESIEMGVLMGGGLGTATFTGSLLKASGPLQGTAMVDSGPFDGATSTWAATPAAAVMAIPVLGPWGTAALVGLLFLAGLFLLLRQRWIG